MKYEEVVAALELAFSEVQQQHEASQQSGYEGPPTEEIISACKRELPPDMHDELDNLSNSDLPPDELLEQIAALIYGADSYGGESEDPYDFFERMGWIEPQANTQGQ